MERREAEVWGLVAALAVNAPEDQQTNLVAALREKVRFSLQSPLYKSLSIDLTHCPSRSSTWCIHPQGRIEIEKRQHVLERSRSRCLDDRIGTGCFSPLSLS